MLFIIIESMKDKNSSLYKLLGGVVNFEKRLIQKRINKGFLTKLWNGHL